ncbi:GNAT family N-acetyltransferase [Ideonella sp.]|jgi:ribosomal protein S18 acetylase RimI-like enzyme|uniref:GNAT family N-acetyltransferase n=1 Tax=Ideonella sp. TaxID=1929293 RepID=UPI0037BF449E
MSIRTARLEDATDIATLLLATRKACMPYAPLAHSDQDVRQWVRDVLLPSGGVNVLRDGDHVLGFVATRSQPGEAWIDQLYVHAGQLRRGVGSRLLLHVLAHLPGPICLYCFQANRGARAFYERHGFEAVAFSDGSTNEERCPDVLYVLP